ncbi:MAG: hypothetical protein LBQ94_06785 [Treponema sp.]|jgi:hypothetical protein|nr:hypothetical protein [Treponema sp.]
MTFSVIFLLVTIAAGIISFFIGLNTGPRRYGSRFNAVVKNYASIPVESIALLTITDAIGEGPSQNDDFLFADVLQYQKETLPMIINMISKVKSND